MTKAEDAKHARVVQTSKAAKFVRFKGGALYRTTADTPDVLKRTDGFERLNEESFARVAYSLFPGMSTGNLRDLYREVSVMAPDYTEYSHLIGFGDKVWDATKLEWTDSLNYVYSSRIKPNNSTEAPRKFLLELAKGDKALADDYLQAVAPLFMTRRPAGVVWFMGDGANGKSSLINALYLIIGKHLVSLTVAAIEDGRATPTLNGSLGNIVRESSESRVEDSERYKAIGTHEPFAVRRMHTHDDIMIDTNLHTIFNANTIPVFSDKTRGARRRTLVVPFPAHFADDPSFEERTFTPEFLGGLLQLILDATHKIRDNGYKYVWSDATLQAKESYDSEVNSAEAYALFLKETKVQGFSNYTMLKMNYESWCSQTGLVSLGITSLKRTITNELGAYRKSVRVDGKLVNRYFFVSAPSDFNLVWLDNGYGLLPQQEEEEEKPVISRKLSEDW